MKTNERPTCNKVIVRLMGGLGNQMFQYAAAMSIAIEWNAQLEVDLSLLNNKVSSRDEILRDFELGELFVGPFNRSSMFSSSRLYPATNLIHHRIYSKVIRSFLPGDLRIQEEHYPIIKSSPSASVVGLVGRFQSQRYFQNAENEVQSAFQFKKRLPASAQSLINLAAMPTTVAIHVRRGDYVSHPVYSKTLGFVGNEYLVTAMELAKKRIGNDVRFVVFSDDQEWCKSFFPSDVQVITESFLPNPAHSDFMLLSKFRNIIISNSTFAWWAAKLAEPQASLIVAPKRWSASGASDPHILPSTWLSL